VKASRAGRDDLPFNPRLIAARLPTTLWLRVACPENLRLTRCYSVNRRPS
jgi:hypothetical protein